MGLFSKIGSAIKDAFTHPDLDPLPPEEDEDPSPTPTVYLTKEDAEWVEEMLRNPKPPTRAMLALYERHGYGKTKGF